MTKDIIQEKINQIAEKYSDKKFLIYGAGIFSKRIFETYDLSKINIVGIADKRFETENIKTSYTTLPPYTPQEIKNIDFDCSLILLKNADCVKQMFKNLSKEIVTLDEYWELEYKNHYVMSHLGSFKQYFLEHNMPDIIKKYKKGMDKKSAAVLDKTLNKMLHIQDSQFDGQVKYNNFFADYFWDEDDINNTKTYLKNKNLYKDKYKLTKNEYNADVFLFKHGLENASDKLKKYVSGKDFVDGGAFIGDSVLVLEEFNPNKIYSFEISKSTTEEYLKVMGLNNVPKEKYEIINMGLSDKPKEILFNDISAQYTNVFWNGNSKVKCTDLDSIVKEKKMNVGFIKADLEGALIPALKGMTKTIRKYRPVLCLAIYHSPEEFFEAKPLLEKITRFLNYKIELQYQEVQPLIINETVLFAYPKELEK